jgi:hypothetical protein
MDMTAQSRPGFDECSLASADAEPSAAISAQAAVGFLLEAARYFERRPTGGEDAAHWSNITNAMTCRRIAALLEARA